MNNRTKAIGLVLALVAIASFAAWPLWRWLNLKQANAALAARAQALAEKDAKLKAAWQKAMEDEFLSQEEAEAIVVSAGETVTPEERGE